MLQFEWKLREIEVDIIKPTGKQSKHQCRFNWESKWENFRFNQLDRIESASGELSRNYG
jgi:hypothetical protein